MCPGFENQLGFDLDAVAVPEGTIPNNATGASVCLGTTGDTYFFGGLAFDTLIRAPNVQIAKSPSTEMAKPGDEVTYTTILTNPKRKPGDPLYPTAPAINVRVCDVLPRGLTLASAPRFRAVGRAMCVRVGHLRVGEARTYDVTARVSRGARRFMRNVATARAANAPRVVAHASVGSPSAQFTG